MKHLTIGAALAVFSLSAASAATDLPVDKINGFKAGQTTKSQILASLGESKSTTKNPDGRSTLLYDYSVPLTDKNKTMTEMIVVFLFDANDVLIRPQFYGKGPNSAAAQPPTSAQPLQAENLLTTAPIGFKIGSQGDAGGMSGRELVPEGETVNAWSRMITIQILHNLKSSDPQAFSQGMRQRWLSDCPGSDVQKVKDGHENGYAFSLLRFACPLNRQTNKPENTFMKFVSGQDAFYVVQYAYRSVLTPTAITDALSYLDRATVCDTRTSEHKCPELTPVGR